MLKRWTGPLRGAAAIAGLVMMMGSEGAAKGEADLLICALWALLGFGLLVFAAAPYISIGGDRDAVDGRGTGGDTQG